MAMDDLVRLLDEIEQATTYEREAVSRDELRRSFERLRRVASPLLPRLLESRFLESREPDEEGG